MKVPTEELVMQTACAEDADKVSTENNEQDMICRDISHLALLPVDETLNGAAEEPPLSRAPFLYEEREHRRMCNEQGSCQRSRDEYGFGKELQIHGPLVSKHPKRHAAIASSAISIKNRPREIKCLNDVRSRGMHQKGEAQGDLQYHSEANRLKKNTNGLRLLFSTLLSGLLREGSLLPGVEG